MLQCRELVLELLPPNTLAACSVAQGIAGLYHELSDDTMEYDVIVVSIL